MKLQLAVAVGADLLRIGEFLASYTERSPERTARDIEAAIRVLASSPYIGRPVDGGRRELIIGDKNGYLALYVVNEAEETVLVLRLRAQREAHYPPPDDGR